MPWFLRYKEYDHHVYLHALNVCIMKMGNKEFKCQASRTMQVLEKMYRGSLSFKIVGVLQALCLPFLSTPVMYIYTRFVRKREHCTQGAVLLSSSRLNNHT